VRTAQTMGIKLFPDIALGAEVHLYCSQRPFQKAPHPLEPEASVNSYISELGVQYVSRMKEVPDQLERKSCHLARSHLVSSVISKR